MNENNPGLDDASVEPAAMGSEQGVVVIDRPCIACSYNLRGLPVEGVCPECGVSVERSLSGDLLRFASPAYLASIHRGVFLVVATIIGQIIVSMGAVVLGMLVGFLAANPGSTAQTQLPIVLGWVLQGVLAVINFMLLYGWWLLSEPDPGFTGRDDGSKARQWVRILTAVQGAMNAVVFMVQIILGGTGRPFMLGGDLVVLVLLGVSVLATFAWAAAFFAQMLYVRWLSRRVPDAWIEKRTRLLIWLGPVLVTVGAACLMIGPLVALVMYWNMLDRLRQRIKQIRDELSVETG